MNELLNKLQENLKELTWKPDFITEVDSDPRWEALRAIKIAIFKDIEWEWKDTDFSSIGGEPIVIEHGIEDPITFDDLVNTVSAMVGEGRTCIETDRLIIVLAEIH